MSESQTTRVRLWTRWHSAAAVVACALLAPLLGLAVYCHPSADDYAVGHLAASAGILGEVRHWYDTWTGRYFAMTVLVVASFARESASPWLATLSFVGLALALARCYYVVGNRILAERLEVATGDGSTRRLVFSIAGCLLAGFLSVGFYATRMPSTAQGFYWMSGSACYTLASALSLILFAELVLLFAVRAESSGLRSRGGIAMRTLLAAALLVMIVGSCELLMAIWCLLLAIFGGIGWQRTPVRWPAWIALVAVTAVAAMIVVQAPGNAIRQQAMPERNQLFLSIALSTTCIGWWCLRWICDPALWLGSLLAIGVLRTWRPIAQNQAGSIRPIDWSRAYVAILLMTACFIWLCPFTAYWAQGAGPPRRALNVAHLCFLLGWMTSLIVAVQAFRPRFEALWQATIGRIGVPSAAMIAAICLFVVGYWPQAARDWLAVAPTYHAEYLARREQARTAVANDVRDIVVPPFSARPKTIYYDDLSTNPQHWVNRQVALSYGLNSIRLAETVRIAAPAERTPARK